MIKIMMEKTFVELENKCDRLFESNLVKDDEIASLELELEQRESILSANCNTIESLEEENEKLSKLLLSQQNSGITENDEFTLVTDEKKKILRELEDVEFNLQLWRNSSPATMNARNQRIDQQKLLIEKRDELKIKLRI